MNKPGKPSKLKKISNDELEHAYQELSWKMKAGHLGIKNKSKTSLKLSQVDRSSVFDKLHQ